MTDHARRAEHARERAPRPITRSHPAWICFDRDCALCRRWAARLRRVTSRQRFVLAPLQAPVTQRRLGLSGEVPGEFKLLRADGSSLGGADAAVAIARGIAWAWPIVHVAALPGVLPLLRRAYRALARRRHCHHALCALPRKRPSARRGRFDAAWIAALGAAFAARRSAS